MAVGAARAHATGYLAGFALGGFFDGILLHQVLQWHHLLSAIDPDNARFQVAADGVFHGAMYLASAVGLGLLWRDGRRRALPGSTAFIGDLLIGFGAWHALDALASHWLLGIHRVRMDSDHRLAWDLAWVGLFGLLPLLAGIALRRRGGDDADDADDADGAGDPATGSAAVAALLVIGLGAQALRPASDSPFTAVLFAPGTDSARVFATIASVGGRVAWSDTSGSLVVIATDGGSPVLGLLAAGALPVGGAGLPAGCFGALRSS